MASLLRDLLAGSAPDDFRRHSALLSLALMGGGPAHCGMLARCPATSIRGDIAPVALGHRGGCQRGAPAGLISVALSSQQRDLHNCTQVMQLCTVLNRCNTEVNGG